MLRARGATTAGAAIAVREVGLERRKLRTENEVDVLGTSYLFL